MTSDQATKFKTLVDKAMKPPHGALAIALYPIVCNSRYLEYTANPTEPKQLSESDFNEVINDDVLRKART